MKYPTMFEIPEAQLEPVETTEDREVTCYCEICDDPIFDDEIYFDFKPFYGCVCESCVESAKRLY